MYNRRRFLESARNIFGRHGKNRHPTDYEAANQPGRTQRRQEEAGKENSSHGIDSETEEPEMEAEENW
jgi:hypothetical protein